MERGTVMLFKPYIGSGQVYDPADPKSPPWARAFAKEGAPFKRSPGGATAVRTIADIDAQLAELQENRLQWVETLRKHCKHPIAARRYMAPYSEDEYGSTLATEDYLFCTDCGQNFNKRAPR